MPMIEERPELPAGPDPERARTVLARKWAYLLSGVTVVSLSRELLDEELRGMLDTLVESLRGTSADTAPAERIGTRLVGLGYVGEPGLRCTLDVLGKGLPSLPELRPAESFTERIVVALGALSCGFLLAHERSVLDQQEIMHLSLLKAVRDAQWNLKQSEARFDEVVTSSASGIALVALDGRIVRANAALAEMLGHAAGELTGTQLADHVHPESVEVLREAMTELVGGGKERIRQSQRLLRKDGDVARISLTASLLRDAEDRPGHFVVVVEDGTELMLLQGELSRQALHDVLTGLPNRQYFGTHLEAALRRADPEFGVTLFHVDLDAFGMVCNSLGRRVGEQLLVHFAQRLKSVMAREKAMIARFHADEFGILVENSATTPDIAAIVRAINDELAEPFFVDGHGLALSASAGVVHRPAKSIDPAELLRAADQTLRRAKVRRRGQWKMFDRDADAEDRRTQALAVGMAGAWENGEIGVRYRPLARLADGEVAGYEACLHWDRPGGPALPHERCAELAESTGLVLPLGDWLLRAAARQGEWWRRRTGSRLPVVARLTGHQMSDEALGTRVTRLLSDTALPPEQLMLGVPVGALKVPGVLENVTALAALGVCVMLDEFGLGPDDLRAVEDLPVGIVRVDRRLAEWQAWSDSTFLSALVPLVRQVGATLVVDGIHSEDQANWWRTAGAELGTGDYFGVARAPGELAFV
ncbi:PAS domain S-box-containing protein/diguanylate cyclase (GGDEF) domain-containing protein [Amycolatopsis pretoriensis]|uniref:PAS domain S-box-containing protein/diguanylate cyclase (GGDEF) domain-containing protein n=1 Tax=Amycolatopsis pretoriensis TaxID=218821 RepID=A0A1H5QQS8_9PSEU|nr:EAL domain-containing protein [Amycolatopsis pretoriensis]SEF27557.1 PAS domain S-box-containing protein/diguanylate cyclase (GGDEF) domain-containing protein [Amycolatopsis pretoriensis]